MATNKLALIRYKTIDKCLSNRLRKWTLDDIVEKVSDELYDTQGIESGVSKRTIQADIELMRSDKLGYNAPIIVVNRKYYTYQDKNYSITNSPITENDLSKLNEIITVLKQMNGFAYFDEMSEMVLKLESSLSKKTTKEPPLIQFESNPLLKGIGHIHLLYQHIKSKNTLLLHYQSFKAKAPQPIILYPYLLKEYRNRWFLICKRKNENQLLNLALDRIIDFQELPAEKFIQYDGISFERYYSDVIGVTKSERDRARKIIFWIEKANVPYLITKPIHPSQKILKEDDTGAIFEILTIINFELERELLGFGEAIKVLSPLFIQNKILKRIELMKNNYAKERK